MSCFNDTYTTLPETMYYINMLNYYTVYILYTLKAL